MSLFIQPHLAPGSIVITWLSHTAPAAPRARRCLGLGRGLGAAEVCPPGAAVGQRMKGPCAVRLGCDVMGWGGTEREANLALSTQLISFVAVSASWGTACCFQQAKKVSVSLCLLFLPAGLEYFSIAPVNTESFLFSTV